MKVIIYFIEAAAYILYEMVNSGKLRFMQFKLDIVEKIINRAKAANIPPKLVIILRADTSSREKIKSPEEMCCLYKKNVRKESRF